MNEELPKELNFKKDFPFYRVVSSFMVAVVGSPAVFLKDNPMNFQPEQNIGLGGVTYPDMGIKPYLIYRKALDGHISLEDFKRAMCMMLASHTYEAVKERNTKSAAWELFRHIRNASAHDNLFTFRESEPSRPAHWRKLTIDDTRKGKNNPLCGRKCFFEFMGISDLLLLLWDTEQTMIQASNYNRGETT